LNFNLKIEALPSLRDQIAERLRNAIVLGELKPGTRLIERELCSQMGVSRTSLREAFRPLENEGLITVVPNRGPEVARVSAETVAAIYEVRSALEGLAARLFVRKATEEHRKAIRTCYASLEKVSGKDAPRDYLALKEKFYTILLQGSGNEIAGEVLGVLLRRVSQMRSVSLANTDRSETSKKELKKLVTALLERNEDAAYKACVEHVENAAKALASVLETKDLNRAT
jgi:DNA-binding GntR family transcriptional regulator